MLKKIIYIVIISSLLNIFIPSNTFLNKGIFNTTLSAGLFSKGVKLVIGGLIVKAITSNSVRIAKYATNKVLAYLKKNPHKTDDAINFISKYTKDKSQSIISKGKILISKIHKNNGWKKIKYQKFPRNGKWSGQKGNSRFIIEKDSGGVKLKNILAKYKIDKLVVRFKNGYPVFPKKFIKHEFEVKGMNGKHKTDMPLIWKHIKERSPKGTFKSEAEVRRWLDKNNLVPHHSKGNGVQLIDKQVHNIVRHNGGASQLRNGI